MPGSHALGEGTVQSRKRTLVSLCPGSSTSLPFICSQTGTDPRGSCPGMTGPHPHLPVPTASPGPW